MVSRESNLLIKSPFGHSMNQSCSPFQSLMQAVQHHFPNNKPMVEAKGGLPSKGTILQQFSMDCSTQYFRVEAHLHKNILESTPLNSCDNMRIKKRKAVPWPQGEEGAAGLQVWGQVKDEGVVFEQDGLLHVLQSYDFQHGMVFTTTSQGREARVPLVPLLNSRIVMQDGGGASPRAPNRARRAPVAESCPKVKRAA